MARFNMWDGWEENEAKDGILQTHGTVRIYTSQKESRRNPGKLIFSLVAFRGKAKKAFTNYIYSDVDARQQAIDNLKASEDYRVQAKADNKARDHREVAEMRQKATLGAIFYTSWGYDQTNRRREVVHYRHVEFYQVVGHKGKSTVIVREIAQKSLGATGPDSENVAPCPDQFVSEPQERRINGSGFKAHEYSNAYPCGDKTSFYRSWGH